MSEHFCFGSQHSSKISPGTNAIMRPSHTNRQQLCRTSLHSETSSPSKQDCVPYQDPTMQECFLLFPHTKTHYTAAQTHTWVICFWVQKGKCISRDDWPFNLAPLGIFYSRHCLSSHDITNEPTQLSHGVQGSENVAAAFKLTPNAL